MDKNIVCIKLGYYHVGRPTSIGDWEGTPWSLLGKLT